MNPASSRIDVWRGQRTAGPRRGTRRSLAVVLAATLLLLITAFAGQPAQPSQGSSSVELVDEWTPSIYRFNDLYEERPLNIYHPAVGSFDVQVRYGSKTGAMQLSWRLSDRNVTDARNNRVLTNIAISVNKRCTVWHYDPHFERANYVFHTTITTFRYCGDAPWTKKRLKPTDTVGVSIQSRFTIPGEEGTRRFLNCDVVLRLQ